MSENIAQPLLKSRDRNNHLAETHPNLVFIRCITPGCDHVIAQIHRKYLEKQANLTKCPYCRDGQGIFLKSSHAHDVYDELQMHFECLHCRQPFMRTMLASRDKCGRCKRYQTIYWAYSAVLAAG